jgi:hypothetical protein
MNKYILIFGDLIAIAILTIVGFATHGETELSFLPRMAALFFPLVVSWLCLAPALRLFQWETISDPRQLWRPALAAPLRSQQFCAASFSMPRSSRFLRWCWVSHLHLACYSGADWPGESPRDTVIPLRNERDYCIVRRSRRHFSSIIPRSIDPLVLSQIVEPGICFVLEVVWTVLPAKKNCSVDVSHVHHHVSGQRPGVVR